MRKLSRETASVLKTLKEARKSMIVTHYGEPVALLTPVIDQWGSSAAPVEKPEIDDHPLADDGEEFTPEERMIIRLVGSGISGADGLARASGLDHGKLVMALARCEMKRAIVKRPWGYVPRGP